MLNWPILIKHPESPQLQLIDEMSQWQQETLHLCQQELQIIDSQGDSYHWQAETFHPAAKQISLQTIIDWVRAHASLNGHCCTAKLGASNIAQVFDMMYYLEDS